jgi:hypothetical protein
LAAAEPALVGLTVLGTWEPIRFFIRCGLRIDVPGSLGAALLAAPVLALAITLTFVTSALQNRQTPTAARCAWALGLLLASPIVVPLYWFLVLRRSNDAS